ncbi:MULTISPECIES: LD-carboxypeptidase [unclassified Pseudoalteromonas]|uniref:S66 peptidase family protein n=1 Tax=Pseudoalteromonas TaxID=53246 RepID=UPI0018883E99|nr:MULTISPECIES: LD-carboxypeptidase [unclassified Pseudoalteromonas]MCF2916971.1 LD-carboxypeptidase [Pseudoalteromonas sp. Cn5-37]NHH90766.1 putative murein peptide carboxypeptidase [Pseudoalteromonas sp. MB47]
MNKRSFLKSLSILAAGASLTSAPLMAAQSASTQTLIKPKALPTGGTIGICSPSAATAAHADILLAQGVIEALGYKAKLAPNILARRGHLAGTDAMRASDLNSLFNDKEVDAILCLRGGSGAARILPLLDYAMIRNNPKPLMGYSDITALHNALLSQAGLISFHGPNASSDWNPFHVAQFKSMFEARKLMHFQNLPKADDELVNTQYLTQTITSGKTSGRLIGGNLTVLTALAGSNYLPDFNGAILFLEDIDEAPYRIDRMMSTLKLMGALDKIAGFVFGDCNDCKPGSGYGSLTLDNIFADYIKPLGIPAYRGAMIGHIKRQFILPVGTVVELDADSGTLKMKETAFS